MKILYHFVYYFNPVEDSLTARVGEDIDQSEKAIPTNNSPQKFK
jgi:hypothetical protein